MPHLKGVNLWRQNSPDCGCWWRWRWRRTVCTERQWYNDESIVGVTSNVTKKRPWHFWKRGPSSQVIQKKKHLSFGSSQQWSSFNDLEKMHWRPKAFYTQLLSWLVVNCPVPPPFYIFVLFYFILLGRLALAYTALWQVHYWLRHRGHCTDLWCYPLSITMTASNYLLICLRIQI